MKKINKSSILITILMFLLFLSFSVVQSADIQENPKIPLPRAYPEEKLPLIDDYIVNFSSNNYDNYIKEILLIYFTNASIEESVNFYQQILNNGNLETTEMLNSYNLKSELDNKTIKINIFDSISYDDYPTKIKIEIEGDFKDELLIQNADAELNLNSTNQNIKNLEVLPDGYPLDLIPIYSQSQITFGEKNIFDEEERWSIQFYSKDDKTIVKDFYKSFLLNNKLIEESQMALNGITYNLVGKIDEYEASYHISDLYINVNDYRTLVNLVIESKN